jgi:hypothetical protein
MRWVYTRYEANSYEYECDGFHNHDERKHPGPLNYRSQAWKCRNCDHHLVRCSRLEQGRSESHLAGGVVAKGWPKFKAKCRQESSKYKVVGQSRAVCRNRPRKATIDCRPWSHNDHNCELLRNVSVAMAVGASMKGKWMENRQGKVQSLMQRGSCTAPLFTAPTRRTRGEQSSRAAAARGRLVLWLRVSVAPSGSARTPQGIGAPPTTKDI